MKSSIFIVKKSILKLGAVGVWLTLIAGYFYYKYSHDISWLDMTRSIYVFVQSSEYGPLLYIIIYIFRPLVFFPASMLTVVSGAVFGWREGLLYTLIGENLSASMAYAVGKVLGSDVLDMKQASMLERWKERMQKNSFLTVFTMRLLLMPFDAVSFVSGAFRIRFRSYVIATFLSIIPAAFSLVLLGSSISNLADFDITKIGIDARTLGWSLLLLMVSLLIAGFMKIKEKHVRYRHVQAGTGIVLDGNMQIDQKA